MSRAGRDLVYEGVKKQTKRGRGREREGCDVGRGRGHSVFSARPGAKWSSSTTYS